MFQFITQKHNYRKIIQVYIYNNGILLPIIYNKDMELAEQDTFSTIDKVKIKISVLLLVMSETTDILNWIYIK